MAELKTVGIIGAGQMGNGIAHVAALAGYDVIMTDISDEALARGMTTIEGNMHRQPTLILPPIRPPSRLRASPRSPTGPTSSSACTS